MILEGNKISFRYRKGDCQVLNQVDFRSSTGERIGLLGPSGYGKSTLAKILAGYEVPEEGSVTLDGKPLPRKGYCPVQLIHQHPEKAINPRWKMKQMLAEAKQTDKELLRKLGVEAAWLERYPRELSGGELQRFCVARALALPTKFIIADEMSTMLDVITAAQIWNVILEEVEKRQLGLIMVTHNHALAERVCTKIVDLQEINHIPAGLIK